MEYLGELTGRYLVLEAVKKSTRVTYELLKDCYERGREVLIADDRGSRVDSEYIVGGLMKGFVERRPVSPEFTHAFRQADPQWGAALAEGPQEALPAIALTRHTALFTAFLNGMDREMIYAQQLYDYGKKGDVFVGISTSGNAKSAMHVAAIARAMGIRVIDLAGKDGGTLAKVSDVPIVVPEKGTLKAQELHLPVCYVLYLMLGEHFYEV